MNDNVFFDTNIWLYLYSKDDLDKRKVVEELVNRKHNISISTQVLNELANVLIRKKGLPVSSVRAVFDEIIGVASLHIINFETLLQALRITEHSKYSYYDSLIVASALQSNSSILYTEDLHDQHIIEKGLKVINPFINK